MTTIGIIGLGKMGLPMAKNLLAAGHPLVFYCRRRDPANQLAPLGATEATSPAEVARQSDVVITIVSADADVREVALGPVGLVHAPETSRLLIDMSTVSPQTIIDVAAGLAPRGWDAVDAPVSGGPSGAESATLTIVVGGSEAQYQRALPILGLLGKTIIHAGPTGAGQTMKLVNQLIGAGTMALIGEGLALARAAGVDLNRLADAIEASTANSRLFESRARKFILADRYEPGFTTRLMRKDLGLVIELARKNQVPLPVAAAAFQQYTAAMNAGYDEDDFSSIARLVAAQAGVSLSPATSPTDGSPNSLPSGEPNTSPPAARGQMASSRVRP